MFENTGLVVRDQQTSPSQQLAASERLAASIARLGRLPVQVQRHVGPAGVAVGGVPGLVSVNTVLRSPFAAQKLKRRVRHCLQNAVPVTLSLRGLGSGEDAIRKLQKFCEYLRDALPRQSIAVGKLGLAIPSHQLPLRAFLLISDSLLGRGPRYVILDSLQMKQHCNARVQDETDRNWRILWQHRGLERPLLPVYGGLVRSACPLLSDEVAGSVLPDFAAVVPYDSAWLPLELPLTCFLHADGHVDWPGLSNALKEAVRLGDRILDDLCWPGWRQDTDARLHRRLAISLGGLGELVLRRGEDPRKHECLAWLAAVVKRIRSELQSHSRTLARESGALPAVLRTDPSKGLLAGPARDTWQACWNAAVRTSALRHRNLLVLSPFSVLPAREVQNTDFFDLLPVIRHADAWCFSTTARQDLWTLRDYQTFHRRAWAVIQGHNEGCAVAAGV